MATHEAQPTPTRHIRLLIPLAIGGAVAIAAGAYGEIHDPSGERIFSLFFSSTINMKVWLATAAVTLGVVQVASAVTIYGRMPGWAAPPSWLSLAHRGSGVLALVLTLPVAYHCLWALGFQDSTDRRLMHSLFGCLFYGAFAAKVTVVRMPRLAGWALPVAGGLLFTTLVVVWYTSSLWFFRTIGFPEF